MIRDRGGKPGRASAFWHNSVWGAFALRRLGWSLATVAGVVAITFLISHIIPAAPAALAAGGRATRAPGGGRPPRGGAGGGVASSAGLRPAAPHPARRLLLPPGAGRSRQEPVHQ